jgi:hypothetical protein
MFRMQDFSWNDMNNYIKDHLESNQNYVLGLSRDSRYGGLVPEIAEKAQGVWPWVYLVVQPETCPRPPPIIHHLALLYPGAIQGMLRECSGEHLKTV